MSFRERSAGIGLPGILFALARACRRDPAGAAA